MRRVPPTPPKGKPTHTIPTPPAPAPAVVVVTPAELAAIVRDAVAEIIAEREDAPARPALLDRRGLAMALDCSPDQVDRLRREGCPELRVGDMPRFDLGEVLAWIRARSEVTR